MKQEKKQKNRGEKVKRTCRDSGEVSSILFQVFRNSCKLTLFCMSISRHLKTQFQTLFFFQDLDMKLLFFLQTVFLCASGEVCCNHGVGTDSVYSDLKYNIRIIIITSLLFHDKITNTKLIFRFSSLDGHL